LAPTLEPRVVHTGKSPVASRRDPRGYSHQRRASDVELLATEGEGIG
jgi:hypothetical protein